MHNGKKNTTKIKLAVKKYTSPVLIVYGKLTEITAGGTGTVVEAGNKSSNKAIPTTPQP